MLIAAIIILYVYFVTDWGQRYMKTRPAYDLSGIIKIYNIVQILINLFIGFYVSKQIRTLNSKRKKTLFY